VALTALMRKLLICLNALLRKLADQHPKIRLVGVRSLWRGGRPPEKNRADAFLSCIHIPHRDASILA
jgi:hypothetical protein